MALLKDLFPKTPMQVAKDFLNNKAKKLTEKGADITNADLYNLCLLNKERDEIDSEKNLTTNAADSKDGA